MDYIIMGLEFGLGMMISSVLVTIIIAYICDVAISILQKKDLSKQDTTQE